MPPFETLAAASNARLAPQGDGFFFRIILRRAPILEFNMGARLEG